MRVAWLLLAAGLAFLPLRWLGWLDFLTGWLALGWLLVLPACGIIWLAAERYLNRAAGIDNDGIFFSGWHTRGWSALAAGSVLTAFYTGLYFGEDLVWPGSAHSLHDWLQAGLYQYFDPLARLLTGRVADKWFVYSTLYSYAVLLFGVRMLLKYRHQTYQVWRTLSVIFFQLSFAWLVPLWLQAMNQPGYYFSYWWPLKPEYLYPGIWLEWLGKQEGGFWGLYFLIFSAFISLIGVPVLTWYFGKRWYCSWVCGCGGLAETMGDPFRQLSQKSTRAWQIERWTIHTILLLIIAITILLWINSIYKGELLGAWSQAAARWYGFLIVSAFGGVIGVGFYPWLGSRIWCRYGCPMAAILGLIQRFYSRFRITTNGGQCISCGNCSTYCEMGIDVRWYAQRGQNIVRASCVGCGVCAAVCPRGVLRLENGPLLDRQGTEKNMVL
ncbi:MAG: 4Fe-4S binding protein [Leptospiraceae bacterium]|nr:4Fe-4S binding protein [Leptospiraceae bacterium]